MGRRARGTLLGAFAALAVAVGAPASASALPPIHHVFVVVFENTNYAEAFGPSQPFPALTQDLASKGEVLTQYYATAHLSLPNYIAMVSGQGPNVETQADCQGYHDVVPGIGGPDGQALGQGCVYPSNFRTVADQLAAQGLTWKGYMEDMAGNCQHPAPNSQDGTQKASATSQYAARHNPFVYFHSLLDNSSCATSDVPLDQLDTDLASTATTPNFAFITPDLCSDAHDTPCADGRPGGLTSANTFLSDLAPKILTSPAFTQDGGLLVVTFDEAEGDPREGTTDASSCCNEPIGPNTINNGALVPGQGGGRIGAVLVSPYITPGTTSGTPYNHYSLLRSIEDIFGLTHLGYAGRDGVQSFGSDVFTP